MSGGFDCFTADDAHGGRLVHFELRWKTWLLDCSTKESPGANVLILTASGREMQGVRVNLKCQSIWA